MKPVLLLFISVLFYAELSANNIQVTNVDVTGQTITAVNDSANYSLVKFTVTWENSWRSNTLSNWDAAWIFVKYRIGSGAWKHALLNNNGHTAPAGSTIDIGLLTPGTAFNRTGNPGIGAFIYFNADSAGTFTATNVKLRWNYGAQGVPDNAAYEIRVYAIEMVYIPQSSFNVGGGGGGDSTFTSTTINTANATTAPAGTGTLGGQAGGYPTGQIAPANASWPNGYAAFYSMKYEVSQQQYVNFLNTLTRTQQSRRVHGPGIENTSHPFKYVLFPLNTSPFRNGVTCDSILPAAPAPVNFYCDLNENGTGGEASDGLWIACNYISWADLAAYLDWSGLRPMTELEYEKLCRGPLPAVTGEYAWGDTSLQWATEISASGKFTESASNLAANVAYDTSAYTTLLGGPMRVGCFAGQFPPPAIPKNRHTAGAGYYGVMELSGNVWERAVSIGNTEGNPEGRAFTGLHGNGVIDSIGFADVVNWPNKFADGVAARGGGVYGSNEPSPWKRLFVSNRAFAILKEDQRRADWGGRGVRSVQ